jgi:hypothetical protein
MISCRHTGGNIRRNEPEGSGTESGIDPVLRLIRAFVAVLGVIAVVIGILYAARTLHLIYSALSNPESLRSILDRWASAVGGKELDVVIAGDTYRAAGVVAIVVLGAGAVVLAWMSMGLIMTGTKVVFWALGNRRAIKEAPGQPFGPGGPSTEGGDRETP